MKIFFVSLGCDKNLVDSEKMLSLLYQEGFELTDDESQAEVIVVNTCCFIHDAKEESIETIIEMGRQKTEGVCKALIAAGCLAQRYHDEIKEDLPEVDGIIGTTAFDQIAKVIHNVIQGQKEESLQQLEYLPKGLVKRVNTTGGYTSYLKIAEGCDKHCSYCIIPSLRGHFRSVPMEELLEEAALLAEKGVVELNLVAQETTLYGKDLYGKKTLPELLRKLCKINGIQWIRLLYCYPEEITEELIQVIRDENKICHYIDMPIQHCNNEILRKMGRRTNKQELIGIISKLRQEIPDITIRTTLISGFPTETEEMHRELVQFVSNMKFERLGVFPYSEEEGTPAASFEGQLPEKVREQRRDEIMEAQQRLAFTHSEAWIGHSVNVLVEGMIPEEGIYVGRTYMDAPNVDGCIFFEAPFEMMSGTFAKVQVTDAKGYDLVGCLTQEVE